MELSTHALQSSSPGTILRDKTIPGLHAKITPGGRRFFLYYRTKSSVERRPKLGDFPVMTLAQARALAKDWLLEVAKGNDPSGDFQTRKAAATVRELIDKYETLHAPKRKGGAAAVKLLRRYLESKLGSEKGVEVEYDVMAKLHADMAATPVLANRVIAHASKLFNLAAKWEKWAMHDNPCHGIERYPERKRKRYMKGVEAIAVAAELDAAAEKHPQAVAFIYLLILSGARKGEIATARREWLDEDVLRLPDSKTGEKSVYLPPAAMAVIARLPRTRSGTLTGILDPKKFWEGIRTRAGCPDLRMHDLRHTFASAAISAGLTLAQIGELLGHSSTQTTQRYAHLIEEAAHTAAAQTADVMVARMKGKAHGKETDSPSRDIGADDGGVQQADHHSHQ